jgi:hypothetical protein
MRREASRIRVDPAQEKVSNTDGSPCNLDFQSKR